MFEGDLNCKIDVLIIPNIFIFLSSHFHASFMTESMNEAVKLMNLLQLNLRLISLGE